MRHKSYFAKTLKELKAMHPIDFLKFQDEFQKECYERYKLAWLLQHKIHLEEILQDYANYLHRNPDDFTITGWEESKRTNSVPFYKTFEGFLAGEYNNSHYVKRRLLSKTEAKTYEAILRHAQNKE